jgi:hypothetical protein
VHGSARAGAALALLFPVMAYSIVELLHAGVVLRPSEAVAIVQKLINDAQHAPPHPPFGPPSIDTVTIDERGTVTCRTCAVKPAVSEIGILLEAMVSGTRLPGGLRYTIARALLNVDAPPFDSIEELSSVLARFERHDRDSVLRDLVQRAAAMGDAAAPAAVIPFKPASPARIRPERRRPMPAVVAAELRRDLQRADMERYRRQAAAARPDLRGALRRQKRPIRAIMSGLGTGILLIASGEFMTVGPSAGRDEPLPVITAPAPRLPEPAAGHLPPAHFIGMHEAGAGEARSGSAARASRAAPSRSTAILPASRSVRMVESQSKARAPYTASPDRGGRKTRSNGVLARFRLQWIRTIFTYRDDL